MLGQKDYQCPARSEQGIGSDENDDAGGPSDGKEWCCGGGPMICGRNHFVKREQHSVRLRKVFVAKPCKGGKLMVEPCAVAFFMAKSCLTFPKHLRFVEFEIDALRINSSLLSVVGTLCWHVVNAYWYIKGTAQAVAAVGTYVSAMGGIQARRESDLK